MFLLIPHSWFPQPGSLRSRGAGRSTSPPAHFKGRDVWRLRRAGAASPNTDADPAVCAVEPLRDTSGGPRDVAWCPPAVSGLSPQ
jgi:hypothetical protein